MSRVPVIQGYRYAIGVAVPFLAGLTGPLAGLKEATEAEGFTSLASDGAAGQWLAEQGWSNVLAYRRGRAPIQEPASGHDYVFIGSRTGPDDYLDTEDPRWAGSLVWVEQTNVLPGAQPRPGELGGDGTPWGLYALGAVAAVATVAVVVSLSGDESPRRNPRRRARARDRGALVTAAYADGVQDGTDWDLDGFDSIEAAARQLDGWDSSAIDAVGSDKLAAIWGVPSEGPEWSAALDDYNRGVVAAIRARVLRARRAT